MSLQTVSQAQRELAVALRALCAAILKDDLLSTDLAIFHTHQLTSALMLNAALVRPNVELFFEHLSIMQHDADLAMSTPVEFAYARAVQATVALREATP